MGPPSGYAIFGFWSAAPSVLAYGRLPTVSLVSHCLQMMRKKYLVSVDFLHCWPRLDRDGGEGGTFKLSPPKRYQLYQPYPPS